VAWDDEQGLHHEAPVSFKKEADKNSKQDLIVFIKAHGGVDWKLAGWRSHATGGGEEDKGASMPVLYFLMAWTTLIAIGAIVANVAILRCKGQPGWELKLLLTILLLQLFFIMSFSSVMRWNSIIW